MDRIVRRAGRKSTGTLDWRWSAKLGRDCWHARYTRGVDHSRTPRLALPATIAREDEAGARAFAIQYAARAKRASKDGKGESVAAYSKRRLADREGRVKSLRSDRGRLS